MSTYYFLTKGELSEFIDNKIKTNLARRKTLGLAIISFAEMGNVAQKFGVKTQTVIIDAIHRVLIEAGSEEDLVLKMPGGKFHWFIEDTNPADIKEKLGEVSTQLAYQKFHSEEETPVDIVLSPIIGYALIPPADSYDELLQRAELASKAAQANLDLVPLRYDSTMDDSELEKIVHWVQEHPKNISARLILQIFIVLFAGWLLPYGVYAWFDSIGHDITKAVYLILVISMVITTALIWIEGMLALKREEPPELEDGEYPLATAIIAAYLPNEADTILETVNAFLNVDYPNHLQVILAYNTPKRLPIEIKLKQLEKEHANFLLYRVRNSQSKAQNINQALAMVSGDFVGIFDADHQPRPDSFRRAWRWLASGYDIVQGHCLVRNGPSSWLSKLVAVEFEAIYAVSHPGRARLHQFAIFGGSNGYWRTDLITKTRMHGFMLTEDIDASIRALQLGHKIKSDPLLVSSELAPITVEALWNQRMRWAQGWHQVSKTYFWDALKDKDLNLRQKMGIFWLLGWREIYPWISIQMYPLVFYWIVKLGGADKLDWLIPIFVITTLFTLSIGPGQVWFSYRLADATVKRHRAWFWYYLVMTSLVYAEFKNWIARLAQVKELMGEKQWKITPRDPYSPTEPVRDR